MAFPQDPLRQPAASATAPSVYSPWRLLSTGHGTVPGLRHAAAFKLHGHSPFPILGSGPHFNICEISPWYPSCLRKKRERSASMGPIGPRSPQAEMPEAGQTAFVLALTFSGSVILLPEWIPARQAHSNDNQRS